MKYNRIFLLTLCSLLLSSCLFEENDFFDETASARIEADMKHAEEVLEGARNGWRVRYFPHPEQEFGGFNLFFRFEDGWVTVASELEDASATTRSLYSIGQESGPTLQIDSKNEMINFFAYPRNDEGIGSSHMGMQGEYLWTIMSASPEKVVLRGIRTGNDYILTPLEADADWTEEMQAYKDMSGKLESRSYNAVFKYDGSTVNQLDATSGRSGYFQYRNWELTGDIGTEENTRFIDINLPYIVTKDGVELYRPVTIGESEISFLKYDGATESLTSENGSLVISKPVPVKSENVITITPTQYYISLLQVKIGVTVPEDGYVVKMVLSSSIEGMSDDKIMSDICRDLREEDFLSGEKAVYNFQMLYDDCNYEILAFGVDKASYMPTTGLTRLHYTTPATSESLYASYKDWIGTWKVVSESSEITGQPQEFTVSIRPKDYNKVLISGWGHTAIREGTEIIAQLETISGESMLRMIPTPDPASDPANQRYVNGMRRLVRCRYQNKDNPVEFVQFGTSKPFFRMQLSDIEGTAVVTGEEGISANGVNYRISSVDCWEENAAGSYVYPGPAEGFKERDFAVGPYVMMKLSDEYGNRPPKASEEE